MQAINAAHSRAKGFTLVELMVVVAIVGLLSSLAYPSFTEYVTRAKRQTTQEALYRITMQQEQFFADNKTYADGLDDLGYPSWLMAINDDGELVPWSTGDKNYGVAIIWASGPSATTKLNYSVYAWPYGAQYTRDLKCGAMRLDESGQRFDYGPSDNCW